MVTIQSLDNSLLFTFTNSNHYFQNGKVEVPKNSLALIVDDSDIASFLKSASNDVFISASYTELGMTKEELISWFEENGFSEGGGGLTPEEAQTMIDESISGKADSSAVTEEISAAVSGKADTSAMTTALADKADSSALTAYFDGVEYNSVNKTIEFYNGNVLKDSIDATDFIKDGMVDNVAISGGNLVITFNTDAGKEDIEIPLIDIFNPNNYYDKTATDGLLDAKVDLTAYTAYTSSTETALNGKASQTDLETVSGDVATKLSTSDFNTYSGGVDTALQGKADASDLVNYVETSAFTAYTSATDTAIQGKASQTDLETVSGNIETALQGKTDLSAFTAYTSSTETTINGKASQTDLNALSGNVDTLSGQVADKADTTAMTTALADKLDISTFTAYSANVDTALQGKADASDLANYVEVSAYTAYTSATDTALSGKASQTDLNTVSGDVATVSGSVANKQDLLVSGTNIKTINNTSLLGSGNIEIQVSVDSALDSGSTNAVANSAITKTIQDNELVVANALITLQTALSGYSLWKGTQTQYDDIVTKNEDTIYFIVNNS